MLISFVRVGQGECVIRVRYTKKMLTELFHHQYIVLNEVVAFPQHQMQWIYCHNSVFSN
jgi:hypothetical protein